MPVATDTIAENQALAERYGEAWNSQDLDAILAAHAEDGSYQLHIGDAPCQGKPAIAEEFARVLRQLPDIRFETKRLTPTETGWTLESTMTGTLAQPAELHGQPVGTVGAKIAVDCLDLMVVREGQIAEKHTYLDAVSMLRQLAGG